MIPSQLPSYGTPRSCPTVGTCSTALTEPIRPDSTANGTLASIHSVQFEPAGPDEGSNPLATTPKTNPNPKPSCGQPSEVERILEEFGHPRSLVEILMNREAITREDLLLLLRAEVRTIRSKLGLGIWEEDQETSRQLVPDETLTTGDTEPPDEYGGNDSKVEKLSSAEMVPGDNCEKAGHSPGSDCHQPERHSTPGTSSVAGNSISRRRPAALDLRKTLLL
ncbi:hypothetical protein MMC32_006746 [Xylographa parallela]|nr:hypothetical protein [Xylographa parallela]